MARKESFDNLSIDSETTYPSNGNSTDSGLPTTKVSGDYAVQNVMRFGNAGGETTSGTYVAIQDSDITINFDRLKDGNGDLQINIIYHLFHDASARIYRQNAGTSVSGTSVSVTDSNGAGNIVETGWIDFSGESGNESYQIQLRDDNTTDNSAPARYNSVIVLVATPQG